MHPLSGEAPATTFWSRVISEHIDRNLNSRTDLIRISEFIHQNLPQEGKDTSCSSPPPLAPWFPGQRPPLPVAIHPRPQVKHTLKVVAQLIQLVRSKIGPFIPREPVQGAWNHTIA